MAVLRAEAKQQSESTGSIGRAKGALLTTVPQQQISVTVVTEFVRWNEEAISRCTLLFSQVAPVYLAICLSIYYSCLCIVVSYAWWPHLWLPTVSNCHCIKACVV
jgi:exocyst complex component 5